MTLPRNLSGDDLVRLLAKLGYLETRQTGSHVRVTTQLNGQHHVTVPRHSSLRVGTLAGILRDVAAHLRMSREELERQLFE